MKELLKHILTLTGCAVLTLLPTSCIDEDNEDCGTDYNLTYDHRLITNMDDEIRKELVTADEVELGKRLREIITADVYREFGRDLDLSFYTDQARSYQQTMNMNADQASYNFYLPVGQYNHMAISNVAAESNMNLTGELSLGSVTLQQITADTIDSYKVGVYTARKDLFEKGLKQSHYIPLYTTTDGAALVLDPQGVETKSIKTYLTDLADGFQVADSVFTFNSNPMVRCINMADTGSNLICHYGIGMPSRDVPMTRTQYDFVWDGAYWEMRVYVTLPSGSITENLLYIKEPLKAGNLEIIKGKLRSDGTIVVSDPEVGVSCNLDWRPGNIYYPDFN